MDETIHLSKNESETPTPTPPGVQTTKTETKIESVETEITPANGRRHRHPGELMGMSGRFWIAFIGMLGVVYIAGVVVHKSKDEIDPQVSAMILGGFLTLIGNVASNYFGQNTGPTKPKTS